MKAEFVTREALAAVAAEWAELCARALEPNPFAEPGFLLPLLDYQSPARLAFVLVRNADGRLAGFAALRRPRVGLARAWMSPYAALPACAFTPDAAPAAIRAVAALLAERTRLAGIVWPFVERNGAMADALQKAGDGLPLERAGSMHRAALKLRGVAAFEAGLDKKRRTKWARQARKLALQGDVAATSSPESVEAFFAVERKGWKGARGTALADDPARLRFARAVLSAFHAEGRLDAMALRLGGAPIAAGLVLLAGDRAFYWKTAYDEAYSEASPGVQLTLAHSRRLAAQPGLAWVDSCAVEDHPMIGRVWGDLVEFDEMALGLRSGGERALKVWLALARLQAFARAQIKALATRARRA